MFRYSRLYRAYNAPCKRQECNFFDQGNRPTCVTLRSHAKNRNFQIQAARKSNNLAVPPLPLREVLFETHPDYHIKDALKLITISNLPLFNHVENIEELEFALSRVFSDNTEFRRRTLLLTHLPIQDALERCYEKSSNEGKIHLINAMVGRFRKAGYSMPPVWIYHGLKAAACGNHPATMKQYFTVFNLAKQTTDFPQLLDLESWNEIMQAILVVIESAQSHDMKTWERKKAQWTMVVTGWNIKDVNFTRRERCIYDNVVHFGGPGLFNYFRLVQCLCSAGTVLRMWLEHHLLDDTGNLPPDTLNFILNSFITTLLAKGDVERAWKVAQNTAPRFGAIHDRLWQMLLHHPEFLDNWIPGMDKSVFAALENYASQIEGELGIRWTGGEDGMHSMDHLRESE